MMQEDTICALATQAGGALGIVRVSGRDALKAVSAICSVRCDEATANTVHYAHIADEKGETVDEAMVTVYRAPRSYTGEDSVEISCHGSRYILNKVLELLVRQGCRMAQPGEYTMRAYLNGKMDLSQAEAVADLIASTNEATHRLAMSQLRGGIASELGLLRSQLLKLTSLLELELDFSDHEDLEFADRTELLQLAEGIEERIARLARSFETGQALKQGIPVAIVGRTNVGKSTLLNRLLNEERAIVSDVHGTTRDTIEDTVDIHGVSFRFIDTAGIRQTTDEIERIGIDRTYAAIEKARIVLWLIDRPATADEEREMRSRCKGKRLITVHNKCDEMGDACPCGCSYLPVSAKLGTNLDILETAIYNAANITQLRESDVIVSNARHYEALLRAQECIVRVVDGLRQQVSGDLVAEDLRLLIDGLAEITGEGRITPCEVLGNIFQHFCVGK